MAKRVRLTLNRIDEFVCPKDKKQAFLWDDEIRGFGVRATSNGAKSFIYETKVNRKTFRRTIGDVSWDLEKARKKAREYRMQTDENVDPREVERQEAERKAAEEAAAAAADAAARAQAEAEATYTLQALCEALVKFLEASNKHKSAGSARSAFNVHVYGKDIAKKPAKDVAPEEIASLVRKVKEDGKERTSGILRSWLHRAYSIAWRAPLSTSYPSVFADFGVKMNPVTAVEAGKVNPRTRTLTAEELQTYLGQLGDTLPDRALKLALYAGGQRMAQLLRAKVTDYDRTTSTLRLFDIKGRRSIPREHLLPLAPEGAKIADMLLERAKKAKATSLFEVGGGVLMASETVGVRLAEISKTMDGVPFDVRDIRRTVETMLAQLKIDRETRAQLLSHGLSGVQVAHYDRHTYTDEKRAALEAWEARLKDIEDGKFALPKASNVVALPAKKRARKK